jgi:flagellar biosynthesis/type III secretory pathway chaperone
MDDIHVPWKNVDEAIKRALKMITDHERFLIEIKRTSGEGLQSIRNEYKSLENFKRTLENDNKEIQQITNNYSEVLRLQPSADGNGEMRIRINELNNRWETLNETFRETLKNVLKILSFFFLVIRILFF